jgi:hypothetical protein
MRFITTKLMENQNNITAVDWLREQVQSNLSEPMSPKFAELFDEARKMEREQIEQAYGDGLNAYRTDFCNRTEYYDKTYGKSE